MKQRAVRQLHLLGRKEERQMMQPAPLREDKLSEAIRTISGVAGGSPRLISGCRS